MAVTIESMMQAWAEQSLTMQRSLAESWMTMQRSLAESMANLQGAVAAINTKRTNESTRVVEVTSRQIPQFAGGTGGR